VRDETRSTVALEELNGAFVLEGGRTGLEGAEIAAFASLRILLPRVEPVSPIFELANHEYLRAGLYRPARAREYVRLTPEFSCGRVQ
jgi:hypothetical protein